VSATVTLAYLCIKVVQVTALSTLQTFVDAQRAVFRRTRAAGGDMGEATRHLQLMQGATSESERREHFNQVYSLVYDDLVRIAHRLFTGERGVTLQPTAVVNELYQRLVGFQMGFNNQRHFMCVAARAMRHFLIDHARRRLAQKRGATVGEDGAGVPLLQQDSLCLIAPANAGDTAKRNQRLIYGALDEAIIKVLHQDFDVVLAIERAVATLQPEDVQLVELRFYSGYTLEEVATILGLKVDTAKKRWRRIKALLVQQLEGWGEIGH
jgi:RNA polymerase sigma-70 factor, ECF subfamily